MRVLYKFNLNLNFEILCMLHAFFSILAVGEFDNEPPVCKDHKSCPPRRIDKIELKYKQS